MKNFHLQLLICVFALMAVQCTDEDVPQPPSPCYTLEKVSGDKQTGVNGEALPQALIVKVLDQESLPAAGIKVIWTLADGTSMETSSGTDGQVIFNHSLDHQVGTQLIIASLTEDSTSCSTAKEVTFSVTAERASLRLTAVTETLQGDGTCKISTNPGFTAYLYEIGYESNLDLTNYHVVVIDSSYCEDAPHLTAKTTHEGSNKIAITSTHIRAAHCVSTSCNAVINTLRVELRSKTDNKVIYSENSLVHRFENPNKVNSVTVSLGEPVSTLTAVNGCDPGDNRAMGTRFDISTPYQASDDLNKYYVEIVMQYKYSGQAVGEIVFKALNETFIDGHMGTWLCTRFGNYDFMDVSFAIRVYEPGATGKGKLLGESNRTAFHRINKPANSNRIRPEHVSEKAIPQIMAAGAF